MKGKSYSEVMDVNMRSRRGAKKLSHVVIEHHFQGDEHMPESHTFGKSEGKMAVAHIAQHMGVEDDPDSAAGAAT